MNKLEQEVYELTGTELNVNSTKQIGKILFDRLKLDEKAKKTKTGGYSASEDVSEKLRSKHPIIGKLLEYRRLKKSLSTCIDALPELINPQTGKIYTSFNQAVTSTRHLGSTNPNLQSIPVWDGLGHRIRKVFIPDSMDCLFFFTDYSQIKLHIMAHLSDNPYMIEVFQSGMDIHATTAAKIYGIPVEKVTNDTRRKARAANSGTIYGISVFGLAERLGIPRSESKELIGGYFSTYPRIKEYMEKSIKVAREKGYVETIFKRKRFPSDINLHNAVVRDYTERNAINASIQGGAADVIRLAMVRIYECFEEEELKSKIVLQVHDELNFNVYKEEVEEVRKIMLKEMENVMRLQIPSVVDYSEGEDWLEAYQNNTGIPLKKACTCFLENTYDLFLEDMHVFLKP